MAYRQTNGMQPSREREHQIVQPVAEEYAGQNFPYRGVESHGVQPTVDPAEYADAWDEGTKVVAVSADDGEPPEPVRVIVVNKAAREIKDWRPIRVSVGPNGGNVLSRNDQRTSARIQNISTDKTCYLSNDSGVSTYTGHPLGPGQVLDLQTTQDVFAISGTQDQVELSIVVQHTITVANAEYGG
jgi:hypothetical protein